MSIQCLGVFFLGEYLERITEVWIGGKDSEKSRMRAQPTATPASYLDLARLGTALCVFYTFAKTTSKANNTSDSISARPRIIMV